MLTTYLHQKHEDSPQTHLLHCDAMRIRNSYLPFLATILFAATALAQQPQHLFFRVTLGPEIGAPASGRLLVFLSPGTGAKEVDMNQFQPSAVYVAAKEIPYLKPGEAVDIDTDDLAFPAAFSTLKPGDYQAQAVLDVESHLHLWRPRRRRSRQRRRHSQGVDTG